MHITQSSRTERRNRKFTMTVGKFNIPPTVKLSKQKHRKNTKDLKGTINQSSLIKIYMPLYSTATEDIFFFKCV